MQRLNLDYYYGQEAEQFTFYRLPKALITDDRYKHISNNAKLLYGLMLDRMSLSMRSGWLDEKSRVYIKYGLRSIMEDLNIGKDLAARLLKELEDIGLIDIIKQSGVANIIYVKNFISKEKEQVQPDQSDITPSGNIEPVQNNDQVIFNGGSETIPVAECDQSDYKSGVFPRPVDNDSQSEIDLSSSRKIAPQLVAKSAPNNTKYNNINLNNNLIYQSHNKPTDEDEAEAYMQLIRDNIDYDIMMSDTTWTEREMFEELYQLICDVVCVPRKTIRIAGEEYPYALVKSKFLKLNASHLQYVLACMKSNTTKVSNIKAYLVTALYNAPSTISNFYSAEVNHDMYGCD